MYNNKKRREKSRQLTQLFIYVLNKWKSDSEIITLYKAGYAPLQVIKLWLHGTNSEIKKSELKFDDRTFTHFKTLSGASLCERLKNHIPYTREYHEIHLAKPQTWKVRCNHLDKSEEDVQDIVKNQLKTWASTTQEKRKKHNVYSIDNTAEYWMKKSGLSYDEAIEKSKLHKREKSPFSVDHWIKKGFSEEAAKQQMRKYHVRGGVAATKQQGSICVSNLERQIYDCLFADFPELQAQYSINDVFVYDICLPSVKKIIEVNGTYWHADPRVYNENDLVHDILVKRIWNRDKKKACYAKHAGYKVLVVWELDFCKSKEHSLKLLKEFLQQD